MTSSFLTGSLRRRAFLGRMSTGLMGIGMADLLADLAGLLPRGSVSFGSLGLQAGADQTSWPAVAWRGRDGLVPR